MLWGEYHAALNTCLRQAWKHGGKVDDKLRSRVRYNSQITVVSLSYLLVELYLYSLLIILIHSAIDV